MTKAGAKYLLNKVAYKHNHTHLMLLSNRNEKHSKSFIWTQRQMLCHDKIQELWAQNGMYKTSEHNNKHSKEMLIIDFPVDSFHNGTRLQKLQRDTAVDSN